MFPNSITDTVEMKGSKTVAEISGWTASVVFAGQRLDPRVHSSGSINRLNHSLHL